MTITADPPTEARPDPAGLEPAPPDSTPDNRPALIARTSVVRTELRTLDDKLRYCEELAKAWNLPPEYRNKPGSLLFAVEYGAMLGLDPVAAINNIHIIEGKPSAAASLLQSMARKAGHRVRIWSTIDERGLPVGHCEIRRYDDPEFPFTVDFTIDDAARAELCSIKTTGTGANAKHTVYARTSKGHPSQWEKWTRNMVKHRALAECVRDACNEALLGIMYTPDELGAEVDAEGNLVNYPEGSAEAAARARAEEYAVRNSTVVDGVIIEDGELGPKADEETRHGWLMDEMREVAFILGEPPALAVRPVAQRIAKAKGKPIGDQPSEDAIVETLRNATSEEIIRVWGPFRKFVVTRLNDPHTRIREGEELKEAPKTPESRSSDRAAAEVYGDPNRHPHFIAPVEQLFGRDPLHKPPPKPGGEPGEPVDAEIVEPDEGSQETARAAAAPPGYRPVTGETPDDTVRPEDVEPHLFTSSADAPDECVDCPFPASHRAHDPLQGLF